MSLLPLAVILRFIDGFDDDDGADDDDNDDDVDD